MFKINRLTECACEILRFLAQNPSRHSASTLSLHLNHSAPMLRKALKHLTQANVLTATRGQLGGYQLSNPTQTITLHDIIRATTHDNLALTQCLTNTPTTCKQQDNCQLAPHWLRLQAQIKQLLTNVTLADLLQPIEQPIHFPMAYTTDHHHD